MELKPRLPISPETQAPGEDSAHDGARARAVVVFAHCHREGDTIWRPLGRITIRPGLAPPGYVAAVRMQDGSLTFGRIYYERLAGGAEFVRLESLLTGTTALRCSLAHVRIEGVVTHVSNWDEE